MQRRAIVIRGIVQGIGVRPFVYNLATRLGLAGFVRNQTGNVQIEVEGESRVLDCFIDELTTKPPPLAQIKQATWEIIGPHEDRRVGITPVAAGSSPRSPAAA
jgi:hydrogenase maturation protein HypF